jgi:hypothetical protein
METTQGNNDLDTGGGANGVTNGAAPGVRRRTQSRKAEKNDRIDFQAEADETWTKRFSEHFSQTLEDAIFELVEALDDVEELRAQLEEMASLRRYRGLWRNRSSPILLQAQRAHADAYNAALSARHDIAAIAEELVRHGSALMNIALENTGDLARLRELAEEVAATTEPWACVNDDLQSGIEADVLVSRALHLLIVLRRETRRIAGCLRGLPQ